MAYEDSFDLTKASNYLKVKYGKAGHILINKAYEVYGMLTHELDFKNEYFEEPVTLSGGAGIGFGTSKPRASNEKVEKVRFTSRNPMARAQIERKLMKLATGGESAFIDAQMHKIQMTKLGFARLMEICLWGDGTGSIGTIDGAPSASGTEYTCTISEATWNKHKWHVGDIVHVDTSTDDFEVKTVTPSSRQIVLNRLEGTQVPADTDVIYFQNSKDVAIMGMRQILNATSGNLYNVPVGHQYQSYQNLTADQVIDEELIDDAVLEIEASCGEGPTVGFTAKKQWKILKSDAVGLKRYRVGGTNIPDKLKARFGFTALEYSSPAGSQTVPILYSRFADDDEFMLVNKERTKIKMTHKPEWFDEDGTVFLRTPDSNIAYEATYGTYAELFMHPTYNGRIAGLT